MNKREIRNAYREYCRHNNRAEFLRVARAEVHSDFHVLFDETHEEHGNRFFFFYGGRAAGRSTNISRAIVHLCLDIFGYRVLAGRSFQNSIEESCKSDIVHQIELLGVSHLFDVYARDGSIRCRPTGAKIIFKGFEHADKSIKSMSEIDFCWWEEAGAAKGQMLDKLEPTIRRRGSRICFSWNPERQNAPIERFKATTSGHELGCYERKTNYTENPWCPPSIIASANLLKSTDYGKYAHVYLGEYANNTDGSIFGSQIRLTTFSVDSTYAGPFIGVDWGFSADPTAVVECYLRDNSLYIRNASKLVGLKVVDTPEWLCDKVPKIKTHTSRADSARPELIAHCNDNGIKLMLPAVKGKNSVVDGVARIQSYANIYIHRDCGHDISAELSAYRWARDRYGDRTRIPADTDNHIADAIRYATEGVGGDYITGSIVHVGGDVGYTRAFTLLLSSGCYVLIAHGGDVQYDLIKYEYDKLGLTVDPRLRPLIHVVDTGYYTSIVDFVGLATSTLKMCCGSRPSIDVRLISEIDRRALHEVGRQGLLVRADPHKVDNFKLLVNKGCVVMYDESRFAIEGSSRRMLDSLIRSIRSDGASLHPITDLLVEYMG